MSRPKTPTEIREFFHGNHPPVVKVRRKLIEELLEQILLHEVAKETGQTGTPDFKAYLRDLPPKVIELLPDRLKDVLSPKPGAPLREVLQIAKLGYTPPSDSASLLNDLWLLYTYWQIWPASRLFLSKEAMDRAAEGDYSLADREPFEGFEGTLDLSLAKFAFKVGIEISGIRHWGEKKEGIARRNLERKAKSMTKEVAIVNAFHAVPKKTGDSRNSIVVRIYTYLNKTVGKKTIERWIDSNTPLMKKCFQEEKIGKVNRWVYIGHTGV